MFISFFHEFRELYNSMFISKNMKLDKSKESWGREEIFRSGQSPGGLEYYRMVIKIKDFKKLNTKIFILTLP